MEVNIQADLDAMNEQLNKLVEKLNKITSARDQLIQKIGVQNLERLQSMANDREQLIPQIKQVEGATMYLRGKQSPENAVENTNDIPAEVTKEVEQKTEKKKKDTEGRSAEYPPDK